MPEATPADEWRTIPGYGGRYEVNPAGQVRSWVPWRRSPVPRLLSTRQNKVGYLVVGLYRESGVQDVRLVHAVVMESFVGPRPDGMEVRHLDGDKMNPALTNLRYGTHSENARDMIVHGTHNWGSRTHCPAGHALDEDPLRDSRGSRVCVICRRVKNRERMRAYRARKRGES